jgi:septum formation protein
MGKMGFTFESALPDVADEQTYLDGNDIEGSIQRLAHAKARSVAEKNPGALVLGADTIVYCEGAILGKPRDGAEGREMLHRLKGRAHTVYSGVALLCEDDRFSLTAVEKTIVVVRAIEDLEIEEYIDGRGYLDKAGAYAIQDRAMVFISRIDGCYYNVVGLPIEKTISLFKAYVKRKEKIDG